MKRFLFMVCFALGTTSIALVAQTSPESGMYEPPEEGGPRRLALVAKSAPIYALPSTDSKVIRQLDPGAILSNHGCSEQGGGHWCKVRSVRGGDRGFIRAIHVHPAKGPDGVVPVGVDDSRRRAQKRDFDADAEIACAQEQGQAMGRCVAQAARSGGGDATVRVSFPNGFQRSLFFVHGEFLRASATMSGVGTDTDWMREKDSYHIRVDDQRYVIPESLVISR